MLQRRPWRIAGRRPRIAAYAGVMSYELDARGLKCPLPVLKARKSLKTVPIGELLTVLATDPGAPGDFVHFCETTGNALIGTEPDGEGVRISIRRLV